MAKISSYGIASTPELSDKLIGTTTGGSPADETKNFTLAQLQTLFGASGITEKVIKVTPAQVLNAALVYVDLLPAPAAVNKGYDIMDVLMFVDFNTTAYDIPVNQQGFISPTTGTYSWCQIEETKINTGSKRIFRLNYNMALDAATAPGMNRRQTECEPNSGISFQLAVNPTQGDSNIYFKITYRILSTDVATDWT